jgi:hypothetical protein
MLQDQRLWESAELAQSWPAEAVTAGPRADRHGGNPRTTVSEQSSRQGPGPIALEDGGEEGNDCRLLCQQHLYLAVSPRPGRWDMGQTSGQKRGCLS